MVVTARAANVGPCRVDDDEADIRAGLQLALKGLIVGEREGGHLPVFGADPVNAMDLAQLGTEGQKAGDNGVPEVVFAGDEQNIARRGGSVRQPECGPASRDCGRQFMSQGGLAVASVLCKKGQFPQWDPSL